MLACIPNSLEMSRVMRKLDYSLCENNGADHCTADQRFRYMDSTIPLLPKSVISSFQSFSDSVKASLCRTWSEALKTGFLASRLKFKWYNFNMRSLELLVIPAFLISVYEPYPGVELFGS